MDKGQDFLQNYSIIHAAFSHFPQNLAWCRAIGVSRKTCGTGSEKIKVSEKFVRAKFKLDIGIFFFPPFLSLSLPYPSQGFQMNTMMYFRDGI
jgi:hypothetical protein